jgi:hypothetical protein
MMADLNINIKETRKRNKSGKATAHAHFRPVYSGHP